MAEVLGAAASVITIAGLFKLCIEAFDLVQVARKSSTDLARLRLRLSIEKCRLYTWGEAIGLVTSPSQTASPTQGCSFQPLIEETLRELLSLFTATEKITARYCGKAEEAECNDPVIDQLAIPFGGFVVQNEVSIPSRIRWVINDREKFTRLVAEVKGLVDGIQEITKYLSPRKFQEIVVRDRVQQKPDALELVSEACEEDYPDISEAVSMRLDVMSMTRKGDIAEWVGAVEPEIDPFDLESLDITELKRQLHKLRMKPTEQAQNNEKDERKRNRQKPSPDLLRTWHDVTGNFKVSASLLGVVGDRVQLHKENGVKVAVPLSKMSNEDLILLGATDRVERKIVQAADIPVRPEVKQRSLQKPLIKSCYDLLIPKMESEGIQGVQLQVLYDFSAREPDELDVAQGDIVLALENPGNDDLWINVLRLDFGWIPGTYLETKARDPGQDEIVVSAVPEQR